MIDQRLWEPHPTMQPRRFTHTLSWSLGLTEALKCMSKVSSSRSNEAAPFGGAGRGGGWGERNDISHQSKLRVQRAFSSHHLAAKG